MTVPILLVTTGGTIVSRRTASGAFAPVDSGDSLLAHLGADAPPVRQIDFAQVESGEITFAMVARLARLLQDEFDRGTARGAVIAHGTDTMEETALLLDLFVRGDAPVVLTGAQLPADDPGTDAGRNLRDAMLVAASDAARGLGALLVFDGKIHPAEGVTKRHASALDAFGAPDGPLGYVDRGRVEILRRKARLAGLPIVDAVRDVDVIHTGLDDDGRLLRAAVVSGARGIVLNAMARGNATPGQVAAVRDVCAQGVPVVLVSRSGNGAILPLNVSARAMHAAGALLGRRWNATQARLLLAVGLAVADGASDVRAVLGPFFS